MSGSQILFTIFCSSRTNSSALNGRGIRTDCVPRRPVRHHGGRRLPVSVLTEVKLSKLGERDIV